MIRIYLNSVANSDFPINAPSLWFEVTDECNGIEDLQLTYTRKDNVAQRAISNSLTFFESAYNFIYDALITNQGDHVWVKIEIDNFNYTFPYCKIQWKAIEWCTDKCELKVNLTTWNEDLDKYTKLKNTLIWDKDFLNNLIYSNPFTGQNEDAHPLMRVKWEPKSNIKEWNYGVLGVFIRHYFFNLCDKVGLIPSSSIFNYQGLNAWTGDDYDDHNYWDSVDNGRNNDRDGRNPYHHSAVFLNKNFGQSETEWNAYEINNRPKPQVINNALNWNGIQFLDNFGQVFNSRYRIKNGLLEFERKDYFYQTGTQWVDLTDSDLCLKIKQQDNWAYLRLEYGTESELWTTSLPEFSVFITGPSLITNIPPFPEFAEKYYDEIVEWNDPVSTRQEGELTRVLPFGKLRTSNNGLARTLTTTGLNIDKVGYHVWNLAIDNPILVALREDTPMGRKTPYLSSEEIATGGFNDMSNRPFYTKKISVKDNGDDWHIWKGTLYDNFHFIDDPRRRTNNRGYEPKEPYKTFEYDMDVDFNCDLLNSFDIDSFIETKVGRASMEEVTFNFKTMTMSINGFV